MHSEKEDGARLPFEIHALIDLKYYSIQNQLHLVPFQQFDHFRVMMNISLEFFFFSASISSSYNQFILNHNEHKNIDYCHTMSILYIYK